MADYKNGGYNGMPSDIQGKLGIDDKEEKVTTSGSPYDYSPVKPQKGKYTSGGYNGMPTSVQNKLDIANKEEKTTSTGDLNAKTIEKPKDKKWGEMSWDEKKHRIDGITDSVGRVIETAKKLKGDNDSTSVAPVQVGNYGAPAVSDGEAKNKEKLERLFGGDGAIDAFSKIDAYVYNYKPEVQNRMGGEKGVDGATHFGPIAQDLAKNPVTSGTVHKDDESGFLTVDTKQLTLTNTAMISQLARKVAELEEKLGGRI